MTKKSCAPYAKTKRYRDRFATCQLCGEKVAEDKGLMLSHVISVHPLELVVSEPFRGVFLALNNSFFDFGSKLGKFFRGES